MGYTQNKCMYLMPALRIQNVYALTSCSIDPLVWRLHPFDRSKLQDLGNESQSHQKGLGSKCRFGVSVYKIIPRVRVIEKIQHSYWKMVRVLKLRFYWNFSTSVLKYISTQICSNFNKIVLKWSVEIHLEMWPVNVACQFFVQVSRWLGF